MDHGNVGAAVAWKVVDQWTGLKYGLGRNKEVFDAELYANIRATVMARDAAVMITGGIQQVDIFTDSHAALSRIQYNEIGPSQTWASAIIQHPSYQLPEWDIKALRAMRQLNNLQRMQ
jgi:ribonuclease HI